MFYQKKLERLFLILFISATGFMYSCDDDTDPTPEVNVTANAGADIEANVGDEVMLDGSGSTVSEGTATYMWELLSAPAGSDAFIQGGTSATALLIPMVEGEYAISLTVMAGEAADVDTVWVTAIDDSPQITITANAGEDLEADVNEEIELDGSGSTVSGGTATYMWEILSGPDGNNDDIQNSTSELALFTPTMAGDYEISLTVMAGDVSDSDTVMVTAIAAGPIVLSCSDINEETTLTNQFEGVDYYVPCWIQVNAGLIIEPGVTIEFAQEAGFEIQDYDNWQGYIKAEGTAEDSITFTGEIKSPGAWESLLIKSEDLRNNMKYCVVEYAGASDGSESAIYMDDESKLVLQHSTIRKNSGYGMFIQNASTNITGYSENTFTKNMNYPLHIAANKVGSLDGDMSSYTGNQTAGGESRDEIYVFSNSIYERGNITGAEVHEWENPGVPFFVNELVYVGETAEGGLRIMEGCEITFGQNFGFWVDEYNASFEILGTETNKVTLKGRNGKGSWNGIYINTNNTLNKIEYAVITDGGQEEVGHWFANPANINLGYHGSDIQLTLNNVEINNSGGCGIAEGAGTINLTINNVTYSNNTTGDYCN